MIPTMYFLFGFLFYTAFCMLTFNNFIKVKDDIKRKTGLAMIFIYYNILAIYIISFVDSNGTIIEIIIQSLIFIVAEGLFLFLNYKDKILNNENRL